MNEYTQNILIPTSQVFGDFSTVIKSPADIFSPASSLSSLISTSLITNHNTGHIAIDNIPKDIITHLIPNVGVAKHV